MRLQLIDGSSGKVVLLLQVGSERGKTFSVVGDSEKADGLHPKGFGQAVEVARVRIDVDAVLDSAEPGRIDLGCGG